MAAPSGETFRERVKKRFFISDSAIQWRCFWLKNYGIITFENLQI
jgi:hypothetical protein